MKNLALTCWFILLKIALIAQLNPVNDFDYSQFYDFGNPNCPTYNCFVVNWSSPDNSMDTLIGYMLFKDSESWIFTGATHVGCEGYSPCTYPDFYNGIPFYLKVRAVYNNDSSLSPAVDSAYIYDILIDLQEHQKNKMYLITNPVKAGDFITLSLGNQEELLENIRLYYITGQLIRKYDLKDASESIQYIPTAGLTSGVYLIEVALKSDKKHIKVLIQ